jgi:proteasome accessory factor B
MTAHKSERLMNLTICLLVARHYISKERIREAVEAYHGLSDDAFDRMFDRDKEELRVLGVPIEVGNLDKMFDDEVGYRIRRDLFELPEVSLEADEAAVVGLAARVWQHASLASATTQGLRKLRAGGVGVDELALAIVEPQLATNEPAFDAVFEAVTRRRSLSFDYQRPAQEVPEARRLEPWGIVSWHGHWYVVGHDQDRGAVRMFRLSRISGQPAFTGEPDSYRPPAELNLRVLAESLAPPHPNSSATIRVHTGAGDALRRRAAHSKHIDDQWTELELAFGSSQSLADELLSYGPDVVVVAPVEVRDRVVRRLTAIAVDAVP